MNTIIPNLNINEQTDYEAGEAEDPTDIQHRLNGLPVTPVALLSGSCFQGY